MMPKSLRTFLLCLLFVAGLVCVSIAADFVQALTGTGGGGAYQATDRVGFQTWNKVRDNFTALNALIKTGTGSPEAAVTAAVGSYYRQTDGVDGTSVWFKATGAGNTGWKAIPTLTSSGSFTNKKLGSLTTNGFVKTSSGDGSLSVDTSTYLTSTTICTTANFCRTTGSLTDAQIKALPTTPITIVAAPGANKVTIFWNAYAYLDSSAGAYTNLNAAAYGYLEYAAGSLASNYLADDAGLSPPRAYFSAVFGAATKNWFPLVPYSDTIETSQWGNLSSPVLQSQSVNSVLRFTVSNGGSGNLTGGNAANTFKWVVYYSIEDAL